ncbi:hypothetical protein JW711_00575 [Candidatus Woesearchaeota archaeon]|nr:hypothetical protein [Candidatus Woesearchaeota archaeon]
MNMTRLYQKISDFTDKSRKWIDNLFRQSQTRMEYIKRPIRQVTEAVHIAREMRQYVVQRREEIEQDLITIRDYLDKLGTLAREIHLERIKSNDPTVSKEIIAALNAQQMKAEQKTRNPNLRPAIQYVKPITDNQTPSSEVMHAEPIIDEEPAPAPKNQSTNQNNKNSLEEKIKQTPKRRTANPETQLYTPTPKARRPEISHPTVAMPPPQTQQASHTPRKRAKPTSAPIPSPTPTPPPMYERKDKQEKETAPTKEAGKRRTSTIDESQFVLGLYNAGASHKKIITKSQERGYAVKSYDDITARIANAISRGGVYAREEFNSDVAEKLGLTNYVVEAYAAGRKCKEIAEEFSEMAGCMSISKSLIKMIAKDYGNIQGRDVKIERKYNKMEKKRKEYR